MVGKKKDENIAHKIVADELRDIINAASKGNAILLGSFRELRRLPNYLQEDEQIIAILSGTPTNYKFWKLRRGIVVATDRRLMFIHDGWVFRTIQDFPYTSINSIEFTTRLFFGDLIAFGFGDQIQYKWIGRMVGTRFAKIVRQLIVDVTDDDPTTSPRNRVPIEYKGVNSRLAEEEKGVDAESTPTPTALPPIQESSQPVFIPTPVSSPLPFPPVSSLPPLPPRLGIKRPTLKGEDSGAEPIVSESIPIQPSGAIQEHKTDEHYNRVTNQLERLAALKEKGLITNQEYELKRNFYIERL